MINTYSFSRGPHHVRSVGRSHRKQLRRRASPYDQVCPRSRRATIRSPLHHGQVTRGTRPSYHFRQTLRPLTPRRATPGRLSKLQTGRRRAGLSRRSRLRVPRSHQAPVRPRTARRRCPASARRGPSRAPNPITPPAWGIALNRRVDLHAIDATYTRHTGRFTHGTPPSIELLWRPETQNRGPPMLTSPAIAPR